MAFVCLASASIYWLGPDLIIPSLVFFTFVGVAIFFATRRRYKEAAFTILGLFVTFLVLPAFSMARVNYRWASCKNDMRNLGLALQCYHDNYGSFPPAYIADSNGKPMHSWRVLILPYIERQDIYDQYRFDEPWDGPNNSQLHSERVSYYECPSDSHATRTETSYLAITGPQTIWPGATSTKMSDIKDGPDNTILLVEAHNTGIHWMEPRDLDFANLSTLSSTHHHGRHDFTNAVFADGHHQALPDTTSAKSLRAALTISGQEKDKLPTVRLRQ